MPHGKVRTVIHALDNPFAHDKGCGSPVICLVTVTTHPSGMSVALQCNDKISRSLTGLTGAVATISGVNSDPTQRRKVPSKKVDKLIPNMVVGVVRQCFV